LARAAEINQKLFEDIVLLMSSKSEAVEKLIASSFLSETTKRNYLQGYQSRLKQLRK
jgi:serine/threonine-protein kinase HipA